MPTPTDELEKYLVKDIRTAAEQPKVTATEQQDVKVMCTSINQQKINTKCTSTNQQEVYISREMYTSTGQLDKEPVKEMCTLIKQQKVNPASVTANQRQVNSTCTSSDQLEVNLINDMSQRKVNPMEELCTSTYPPKVIASPKLEGASTSTDQQRKLFPLETIEDADEDLDIQPETKEPMGHVGFANILKQAFKKVVKQGFDFTLMVVGESGLGKSTLINSMFLTDIYNPDNSGPPQRLKKTVTVEATHLLLREDGVNLSLTLVDTPGFGDAVDNSKSWEPISNYIDSRFDEFLNSEAQPIRKQARDERVHCCLYFIQPSGHGLKPLDIEFMKRLCDKVNVIPVIGKADTLTSDECAAFKKQIMFDIAENKIKIYDFPDPPDENDNLNKSLRERIPFAVVGSNALIEINGKKLRGRKYPWGIAEVENLEHCDFVALRTMMISTHLYDLKDVTSNVHYENYRLTKMATLGPNGKPIRKNKNVLGKEEQDLKNKLETEMREKEQQLKNSVEEVNKRLESSRKKIEEQAKELDEKRKQFEFEKEQWEKESHETLEELNRRTLEVDLADEKREKQKKKKRSFFNRKTQLD